MICGTKMDQSNIIGRFMRKTCQRQIKASNEFEVSGLNFPSENDY